MFSELCRRFQQPALEQLCYLDLTGYDTCLGTSSRSLPHHPLRFDFPPLESEAFANHPQIVVHPQQLRHH